MEWISNIFNWFKDNLELIKWIGLGIVIIILSPIIIGIIKSLIKGIISIVKLIWDIVSYPFKLTKKIGNVISRKKNAIIDYSPVK